MEGLTTKGHQERTFGVLVLFCVLVVVIVIPQSLPVLKLPALDIPGGPVVESLPANAGDRDLIPGLGRSPLLWGSSASVP